MDKINCGYCKKKIKKGSKECPYCGKKFKMFEKEKGSEILSLKDIKFKKYFLMTLIIALGVSALMGIFIFIFGRELGETEGKILATTLSIGGFSITGLCAAFWYEKRKFLFLSYSGMIASVFGFLYSLLLIWEIVSDSFNEIKPLLILIIISVAIAHSCLVLLSYKEESLLKFIVLATIICISIISLMLIGLIIWEWDVEEIFFRILGVFAILIALGTISLPILNKIKLL